MSVTVSEAIKIQLFIPQGKTDTPLPIGQWLGSRQTAGDLTGGVVQCLFTTPGETPSYLFSWEEASMGYYAISGATHNIIYELQTQELYTDVGGTANALRFVRAGSTATSSVSGLQAESQEKGRSLFKFIFQPRRQTSPIFTVCLEANDNGVVYRVAAWGYLWHPQARRMAGGPIRPG